MNRSPAAVRYSPRTSQYGRDTKARIACSLATSIARVGVCTRPIEYSAAPPPPASRARAVTARVAFIPTSQSASDRERAASASRSSCAPGRSAAKPRRIASSVSDEIHSRQTGGPPPAYWYTIPEDQLALAPRVARVHHRVEPPIREQPRHHPSCARRVLRRPEPQLRRQHRQRLEPPAPPPRVVRRRLLQLDQVPDAPRDDAATALEEVPPLRPDPQHARQVARDGGLLGHDQLHICTLYGGYVIDLARPSRDALPFGGRPCPAPDERHMDLARAPRDAYLVVAGLASLATDPPEKGTGHAVTRNPSIASVIRWRVSQERGSMSIDARHIEQYGSDPGTAYWRAIATTDRGRFFVKLPFIDPTGGHDGAWKEYIALSVARRVGLPFLEPHAIRVSGRSFPATLHRSSGGTAKCSVARHLHDLVPARSLDAPVRAVLFGVDNLCTTATVLVQEQDATTTGEARMAWCSWTLTWSLANKYRRHAAQRLLRLVHWIPCTGPRLLRFARPSSGSGPCFPTISSRQPLQARRASGRAYLRLRLNGFAQGGTHS